MIKIQYEKKKLTQLVYIKIHRPINIIVCYHVIDFHFLANPKEQNERRCNAKVLLWMGGWINFLNTTVLPGCGAKKTALVSIDIRDLLLIKEKIILGI